MYVFPVNPKDVGILQAVQVESQDSACGSRTVFTEEDDVGEDGEPIARSHVVSQNLVDLLETVDQSYVGKRRPYGLLRGVQDVHPAPPTRILGPNSIDF